MRSFSAAAPSIKVATRLAGQDAAVMSTEPGRQGGHGQRFDGPARRAMRQQRRHQHQRQQPADQHAVADEAPELLQAGEVDDSQPVERRRRRPHAEQHAGRGTRFRRDGGLRRVPFCQRQPVRDIHQHDAVDAEAEQHGGRPGGGGRQRDPANPITPSTTSSDSADGSEPDDNQPQTAEHHEQQRHDQRSEATVLTMALAPDEGFGFDRDPMTPGEPTPGDRSRRSSTRTE